jgi:hypothetical protein
MSDPSTPSLRLQAAIAAACEREREREWQARVAAGIYAALDFAASDPAAAREVAAEAESERGESGGKTIEWLRGMLAAVVPAERYTTADATTVRGLVTVVAGHLHRDREDDLAEIGPDLVCLTLLPYVGFEEAKRWAR